MRVRKGQQQRPSVSSWSGGWALQANLYHWNRTGSFYHWSLLSFFFFSWSLLLLLLLPDNSPLFLHSFVPLRSLNTQTCSRASTVARLRLQNGLGPKWLLFCQESHAWFSFSGDSLPYLLAYRKAKNTIWRDRANNQNQTWQECCNDHTRDLKLLWFIC